VKTLSDFGTSNFLSFANNASRVDVGLSLTLEFEEGLL
jgi:hypothetical protein